MGQGDLNVWIQICLSILYGCTRSIYTFLFVMHYIGLFRLCLAQWLIDEFGDSNIIFFYFFKIAKYSFKFSHHSTIIITLKENQTATHYTSK